MQSRDFIENSDDFLQSLLIQSTESEKLHTEYLFQHGHYSSAKLPNRNSINFKCQQKIEQDKKRPFGKVFEKNFISKKIKLDKTETVATQIASSSATKEPEATNIEIKKHKKS